MFRKITEIQQRSEIQQKYQHPVKIKAITFPLFSTDVDGMLIDDATNIMTPPYTQNLFWHQHCWHHYFNKHYTLLF